MQGLFRRLWQWLKRLFGLGSTSRKGRVTQELPPLTDTDYEFLFMQLLEGIAHGWHEGRVLRFFHKLDARSRPRDWVAWLERFGERIRVSSAPNQILAARMMRLGELARAFPEIEPIGAISFSIGRELYSKTAENLVWEYEGPDSAEKAIVDIPLEDITPTPDDPTRETLTLDELFTRLQSDPDLVRLMGEQLGVETTDANAIVQALVDQFQSAQLQLDNEQPPESVDDWFERGLKQAEVADWEGAIASWDRALALDPDLAQAWHNRGSALGMLGRLEEALVCFDRAIALDPDDAQIWNIRGSALYGLERWQEALDCWEKALELEKDYYPGWYNRGCVLEILGRREDAIASYQKALEIQPDFNVAQARLNDLLEGKS